MKNRMLKAALRYAKEGWPVFALHSVGPEGCTCGDSECSDEGKHPRTAHGFKDATTDTHIVRTWWKKWPNANIGIATGTESGIVVLDIDSRHDGFASLLDLERRYGR